MRDKLGREIEYLRISITQSCNLSCIYCAPQSKTDACLTLTSLQYKKLVTCMAQLGIKKIRITGGEPLTRPDVCQVVEAVSSVEGIEDVSMTTNGIYLGKYAKKLKEAGLKRINISLDSLRQERFRHITGTDQLDEVLVGMDKAVDAGLYPIRINTVLMKGLNEDEVDDFFKIARESPVDVRFIELMPVGSFGEKNHQKVVYNSQILSTHPELIPLKHSDPGQPAKYYTIPGYKGRIGFISPMSHKFCHSCNRIRLTCDGKIKPCLGDNGEVDIMGALHKEPQELLAFLRKVIYEKPDGHHFEKGFQSMRDMNRIGG
ncbi:MAG: GTP 3',8-cyclase MoaA [Clostridia bacterium]|nr:GTP 3',8-cyclase MoaA [Clostridia bacterium]